MKMSKEVLSGIILAIICVGAIIISIETERSFFQIFLGFIIFFFPITFFSVFNSRLGAFVFVFIAGIITYVVSKFFLFDFWIGVLLALLLGGSLYLTKVSKYKVFNAENYKQHEIEKHKNNKIS